MINLIGMWQDWRERREILRDIRRRKRDMEESERFRFRDAMMEALSALRRDDHERAARIWKEAAERCPGEVTRSTLALDVLRGLKRFGEAEALLNEGQKKNPDDISYAIGLAKVARSRGDLEVAVHRAAHVRKRSPNILEGYSIAIQSLRELNRLQEAEALTVEAMAQVPKEVLVFMEHARIADARQDWEQSLRRWDVVRQRFDHSGGYMGAANAMIKLGRYDEAEVLLEQARVRFPMETGPAIGMAQIAQARGDRADAVIRWKRLAQGFALDRVIVLLAASNLLKLDAPEVAAELLREAVDHFPADARTSAMLDEALSKSKSMKQHQDPP